MCASVEVTPRHFFVNCLRSLPAFAGCFLELNDVYWVLSSTNVFFKVSTHFYDEVKLMINETLRILPRMNDALMKAVKNRLLQ